MADSLDITGTPKEGVLLPAKNLGIRKNGKPWKDTKAPKRIRSVGLPNKNSYELREKKRQEHALMKEQEQRMKAEKAEAQQERIKRAKDKAQEKADKERYERLSEKMHKKRVERLKKREKRNKLLKER